MIRLAAADWQTIAAAMEQTSDADRTGGSNMVDSVPTAERVENVVVTALTGVGESTAEVGIDLSASDFAFVRSQLVRWRDVAEYIASAEFPDEAPSLSRAIEALDGARASQ